MIKVTSQLSQGMLKRGCLTLLPFFFPSPPSPFILNTQLAPAPNTCMLTALRHSTERTLHVAWR